jgi:DNA-binding MarR family transcriptional regulator
VKQILNSDEIYNLWTMLEQVHSGITLARDRELEPEGLSTIKASALFIINAVGEETTPAEVSRWILRRPHSVTALLLRMEKDGLIKRAKDLPKKNLIRITLTPKGHKAFNISLKRKTLNKILSVLTEEERRTMYSYLEKLRTKALKVLVNTPTPPFPMVSTGKAKKK